MDPEILTAFCKHLFECKKVIQTITNTTYYEQCILFNRDTSGCRLGNRIFCVQHGNIYSLAACFGAYILISQNIYGSKTCFVV
jgi:hypothetical protein